MWHSWHKCRMERLQAPWSVYIWFQFYAGNGGTVSRCIGLPLAWRLLLLIFSCASLSSDGSHRPKNDLRWPVTIIFQKGIREMRYIPVSHLVGHFADGMIAIFQQR